jgi:hypothetical protein
MGDWLQRRDGLESDPWLERFVLSQVPKSEGPGAPAHLGWSDMGHPPFSPRWRVGWLVPWRFLRLRSFFPHNLDCAPERLNYLHAGLYKIRSGTPGRLWEAIRCWKRFVLTQVPKSEGPGAPAHLGWSDMGHADQDDGCPVPACKLRSVVSPVSNCERPGAPRSSVRTYYTRTGAAR